jgi:hypothetical protein
MSSTSSWCGWTTRKLGKTKKGSEKMRRKNASSTPELKTGVRSSTGRKILCMNRAALYDLLVSFARALKGVRILRGAIQKKERQKELTVAPSEADPTGALYEARLKDKKQSVFLPLSPVQPGRTTPPERETKAALKMTDGKTLMLTWRKQILELVKLAQKNLTSAKELAAETATEVAVDAALRSVENVSRALLYCFGEKPETCTGQEEPLRLLAHRFKGTLSINFQKTVEETIRLHQNRARYVELGRANTEGQFNYARAKLGEEIIECAASIFAKLRQTMDESVADEIPELREACPNCRGLDLSMMTFNEIEVKYTCKLCRHTWNEPRYP